MATGLVRWTASGLGKITVLLVLIPSIRSLLSLVCIFKILTGPSRTFEFNIHVGLIGVYDQKIPPPTRKLVTKVSAFIKSMQKLDRLVFVVPEKHAQVFARKFAKANVLLPQVEAIIIGPFCEFVVKMCPNIKAIATSGWDWILREGAVDRNHTRDLIKSLETTLNLAQIKINAKWNVSLLEGRLTAKVLSSGHWSETRC